MSSFHRIWGEAAIWISGAIGVWGVLMWRRETPPRIFFWAVGVAVAALLAEVVLGVFLISGGEADPGDQHVFYGVLIAFSFAFAYIYRAQFRKRPALYYGLLLLFTMGLGIRGIMTFGLDF